MANAEVTSARAKQMKHVSHAVPRRQLLKYVSKLRCRKPRSVEGGCLRGMEEH